MPKFNFEASDFQKVRQQFVPTLPRGLQSASSTFAFSKLPIDPKIAEKYPKISAVDYVEFQPVDEPSSTSKNTPLKIGVVLSGGQAPGGHNVIMGVFDFLKRHHPDSEVIGFLSGPKGIFTGSYMSIDDSTMDAYRNQGGFDMICSGRDKIETEDQYAASLRACTELELNGLIVIGGDDSNTNAALLAEYFMKNESPIRVIGCPKTIDGDLKNEFIEISFGFDTATKTYNECIGNVCLDAVSTKKYYHFVRLMGRSASHIALECELQTRANLVLIGEEVQDKNQTLSHIVQELADMIVKRGDLGKNYGVVLVPEGLIEFIPEVNQLIKELNEMELSGSPEEIRSSIIQNLTTPSAELFAFLPEVISNQLLLDRDPHGNVQVAKIETERLLIMLLEVELLKRQYKYKFLAQSYYFGYEGRSCLPSNFDAIYCYALGNTAASLVKYGFTGCMAVCRNLTQPPERWSSAGCPLAAMMNVERRSGKDKAVIKKALVELDSACFLSYEKVREFWKFNDCYRVPGPIQFDGVGADSVTYMLQAPTVEDLLTEPEATNSAANGPYYKRDPKTFSPLMADRVAAAVDLPKVLKSSTLTVKGGRVLPPMTEETAFALAEQLPSLSRATHLTKYVELTDGSASTDGTVEPLNVGVVFLCRQAPGAHNVIDGILTATAAIKGSKVFGFLGGEKGFTEKQYFEITRENFSGYCNTGGLDFLGRGGHSIRGPGVLESIKNISLELKLDGLVIAGATHALNDAALLADFLLANDVKTKVIGVPLTIHNNLEHELFEATIGFDTAAKVNAELVGNMMTDSSSATKYYYFIRLMGRAPSHLALECALQTHPNLVLIGEKYKHDGFTLDQVVVETANNIQERAKAKKNFGVVLVPEGLILQLPHYREMVTEIETMMGPKTIDERAAFANQITQDTSLIAKHFTKYSAPVFEHLPAWFQVQLLTRIDSSGELQLSLLETERLLSELVAKELSIRKKAGLYKGSFGPVCHFFGYQGRCSFPTVFDCSLGSSYGATAVALIQAGYTAYMTTARGLTGPAESWTLGGIPLTALMRVRARSKYGYGKVKVPSADVTVTDKAYLKAAAQFKAWSQGDHYSNPGPIQFYNDAKFTPNATLSANFGGYAQSVSQVNELCARIASACRNGVKEEFLNTAVIGLTAVEEILNINLRNK